MDPKKENIKTEPIGVKDLVKTRTLSELRAEHNQMKAQ